jgi:hypothetical protein
MMTHFTDSMENSTGPCPTGFELKIGFYMGKC